MIKAILLLLATTVLPTAGLPAHEHHPPHHGSLQVFGEDAAHLELVLDAKTGRLTAYALDGEAEEYIRLAQPSIRIRVLKSDPAGKPFSLTLRAVANVLTGEKVGDSAEFETVSPHLRGLKSFEGRFGPVSIRGLRFGSNLLDYPLGNEEH
ncbi:MAG TPA: hypothetical protein VK914_13125 [bacterium]|jgi:hypothetical protein|nr:hypothetical protein [bacterium]